MEIYVCEILKRHSSSQKRLSGADIVRLLESEFGIVCDRKTVHRALESLTSTLKNIKYTENLRGKAGKQYSVRSEWYFESYFSVKEMQEISISILKNDNLEPDQRANLLSKLQNFASLPFDANVITACTIRERKINFTETIIILADAINARKMVSFSIVEAIVNDKKRMLRDRYGNVRQYLVKPLDIISVMGEVRLFGELGDTGCYVYFDISELYCLEISDIEFERSELPGKNYLPQNKAEAYLSYGGKREKIVISLSADKVHEFKLLFGDRFEITREYGEKVELTFECNINSALPFLLQLGDDAEVMSPSKLRRALALTCKSIAGKYLASKQYRGYM